MMIRQFSTSTVALKRCALSKKIPQPTKDIPDVAAFLGHIGRNTGEFSEAFPTWESLFSSSSREMKAAGIDPKPRKYILEQVERFRKAAFVTHTPVADAIKEIKLYPKKNGGERKLNQYLAKKRILDRIELAKSLKQFRISERALQVKYRQFEKLHTTANHTL